MLTFDFDIRNAGAFNCRKAEEREQQRLAVLCAAADNLGHRARIVSIGAFAESPLWKHFENLYAPGARGGIKVVQAEHGGQGDVGVKCSINSMDDHRLIGRFRVLVAHEHQPGLADDKRLVPVPFLAFQELIDSFAEFGLLDAYLSDELQAFREPVEKQGVTGFIGKNWRHRRTMLSLAPEWVHQKWYDTPKMNPWEHFQWLKTLKAGLLLPGDTSKTQTLHPIVLAGIPIVAPRVCTAMRPELNERNSVVLGGEYRYRDHMKCTDATPAENWEQVRELIETKSAEIVAQADEDYKAGWSPMGQMRLIAEKFA